MQRGRREREPVDAFDDLRGVTGWAPPDECVEGLQGHHHLGLLVWIGEDLWTCYLLGVPHLPCIVGIRMDLHRQGLGGGQDLGQDGRLFAGESIRERRLGRIVDQCRRTTRVHAEPQLSLRLTDVLPGGWSEPRR